jgi:hypothetical protein
MTEGGYLREPMMVMGAFRLDRMFSIDNAQDPVGE